MTHMELATYLKLLSDGDRFNLAALSEMPLDRLEELIKIAPTEDRKQFVQVAAYIHIGSKLSAVKVEGKP